MHGNVPSWAITTVAVVVPPLVLLCLYGGFRCARRRRLLEDTPTLTTRGVFIGMVELKGTAESDAPLVAFLTEQHCVWHKWSVDEHWRRTVTERYTDSDGKSRTRTRVESGWTTVASGGEEAPFYLRDDDGVILVRPEGAKVEPLSTFSETCTARSPLYYGKGPAGGIVHSTGERRFTESSIPLHTPLYVFGCAREREDIVAPEIAADRDKRMYLISARTEETVRAGYRAWSVVLLLLAPLLAGGGLFVLRGMRDPLQDWQPYAMLAAGYAGLIVLLWAWTTFNSLVELRQRVAQAWSLIDVQLRRRADLIPNLVAAVRGYAEHEAAVQEMVTRMRAQLSATPPGDPGDDPSGVAPVLAMVVERYPELKANESFLNLQHQLVDTEQRIALARGYFNDIATFYNTRLGVWPDSLLAGMAGFKPRSLILAGGFERAPVEVNFEEG